MKWSEVFGSGHRMAQLVVAMGTMLVCCSAAHAVNLGGKQVPREKFIVYILIGHSNMVGRNNDCDNTTHARAWNFKIDDGTNAWVPAKGPIFYDGKGKKSFGTFIGCGPGMHLVKRLVKDYPDHHFGVIERAWSGGRVSEFRKGGQHYNKIMPYVKKIQPDVTLGGILCMLGRMERCSSSGFAESIKKMVEEWRTELGEPNLPYFQQLEKNYDSCASKIRVEQMKVAQIVSRAAVISVTGPEHHQGHYNGEGERRWANEAVDIIQDRKWFPQISSSPLPFSPSRLSATGLSGTEVELVWNDNSNNESGFKIERKKCPGGYAEIARVGAGTSRYTDKGLAPSTEYSYRVRAYNAAGDSGYSNEATVSSQPTQSPPEVVIAGPSEAVATIAADFYGGNSTDDGLIVSYTWDFGDGARATGRTVSHTWSTAGTYTVVLKVTDSDGLSASRAQQVVVDEAPQRPTIALQSPVAGDTWIAGSKHVIRWTPTNLDVVRIDFSRDGGAFWRTVTDSVDNRDPGWTQYEWQVPDDVISDRCIVMISDYDRMIVSAKSGEFEVVSGADKVPPVISFSKLEIAGSVSDPTVTEIRVGGSLFPVTQNVFVSTVPVTTKPASIAIRAQDDGGNAASRTLGLSMPTSASP